MSDEDEGVSKPSNKMHFLASNIRVGEGGLLEMLESFEYFKIL